MKSKRESLLKELLSLPEQERAAFAGALLKSLEHESQDEEVEKAWAREVARRVDDIDSGRVETVAWTDLREEMIKRERDAAS